MNKCLTFLRSSVRRVQTHTCVTSHSLASLIALITFYSGEWKMYLLLNIQKLQLNYFTMADTAVLMFSLTGVVSKSQATPEYPQILLCSVDVRSICQHRNRSIQNILPKYLSLNFHKRVDSGTIVNARVMYVEEKKKQKMLFSKSTQSVTEGMQKLVLYGLLNASTRQHPLHLGS